MPKFPRTARLLKKQDFNFVFTDPQKVSHKYLVVLYRANTQSESRLGIIVKKQLFKHAHKRNQIRRIVRESFRHYKTTLKGLDMVVLLRSKCTTLNKKNLRDDVDRLWQLLANLPKVS